MQLRLVKNISVQKEEWQKLFSDFTEVRKVNFEKYRDLIFSMRMEVNEKEWKELTD